MPGHDKNVKAGEFCLVFMVTRPHPALITVAPDAELHPFFSYVCSIKVVFFSVAAQKINGKITVAAFYTVI
jgi:hypothetical protein